jgi:hypothetical protein
MKPKIKGAWLVSLSENGQHRWLIGYEFCGVPLIPMTVYARDKYEAIAEAANRL